LFPPEEIPRVSGATREFRTVFNVNWTFKVSIELLVLLLVEQTNVTVTLSFRCKLDWNAIVQEQLERTTVIIAKGGHIEVELPPQIVTAMEDRHFSSKLKELNTVQTIEASDHFRREEE